MGIENEPVSGGTRLVRMLLLASVDRILSKLVENHIFRCCTYGPYSETIDRALNYLVSMGLSKIISMKPTCFNLTDEGLLHAVRHFNQLSNDERNALLMLKFEYNSMNRCELLQYIYSSYPEYSRTPIVGRELFDI